MRSSRTSRAVSVLIAALAVAAGPFSDPAAAEADGAVAFIGVHVVPLHEPGIRRNQTVIVRGDRIETIGPVRRVEIPADAVRIEARGRFLMPGLADMHVHTGYRDEHMLYIGYGVTTIREMWARGLGWVKFRDEVNNGESFGATMFVAGMALVGPGNGVEPQNLVETASEARAVVQRLVAEGHDFIKVHEGLGAQPYAGATAMAKRLGIPVVGHVPALVGVQPVLNSGVQRSISHLSRLFLALGASGWQDPVTVNGMRTLARELRDRNIYNEATLATLPKLLFVEEMAAHSQRSEYEFLPAFQMEWWIDWVNQFGPWDNPANRDVMLEHRQAMIREMHRIGAPLLIGTDGGFPFVMPGRSMHDELALHVQAGLTPYEVLHTATIGAAEFLDQEEEFGSVQEGLRADLVLLRRNPLKNIRNTLGILGVMVRGRWLDEEEIEQRLIAVSEVTRVADNSLAPAPRGIEPPPWYPGH